jgi:glycerate 2-kinase
LLRVINKDEILGYGDVNAKSIILDLLEEGMNSIDPYIIVKDVLGRSDRVVRVFEDRFRVDGRIYVLGLGKASARMARAVEEVLGDLVEDGLVVTKYGYGEKLERIRVLEAGHPVPDENSLRAGLEAFDLVRRVGEDDLLLTLISGGGSSLLVLPPEEISFEDLAITYELLIGSGASISEVNIVRRHLSMIKGGGIVRNCRGRIISLIISDVVGDRLEDIASGPTSADPTSFMDAYRVLKNYGLWDRLPESVRRYVLRGLRGDVEDTLKKLPGRIHNYVVANNRVLCEKIRERALARGLRAYILTTTLEGEARDSATALGSIVQEIHGFNRPFHRPVLLIAGGETTVALRGRYGLGGPNQEFALSITRKIRGLRGTAVLAFDTDGTDGPTDAGGGIVDNYTYDLLVDMGVDVVEVLNNHDSYNALRKASSLVFTGPTRTNVNSVYLLLTT